MRRTHRKKFSFEKHFLCFRCGKLLKDSDAATAHAVRTNHSSFSECTDVIKPLTAEEKEEMKKKYPKHHKYPEKFNPILYCRIQERIAVRRKEQQVEEEQKAKEMERKRIVDGKVLLELKQK